MNDSIFRIINESLELEDNTVFLTEEEILNESIFFKVSPFVAFTAFKQKAFNSILNSNSFLKLKKGADTVNPLKGAAKVGLDSEKLKSKVGSKGKNKDDTVYKLMPEQKKVLAEMYNKYGKELVGEIQSFRDNTLAPYQLIKRTIKKNRILTSKEVNGMSKEEFLAARESGRKKIEKRGRYSDDTKSGEEALKTANESLAKAREQYELFSSGKIKDISNESVEKMFKVYDLGLDSLQGYPLSELKSTYEAIVRNKALIEKKLKYEDDKNKVDVLELLRKNRILREKGSSSMEGEDKKDEVKNLEKKLVKILDKKEGDNVSSKRGSFTVAFSNYMLRNDIRNSFKSDMGGEIYKATYRSILKDNIKNISEKREEYLSSFVKQKKNIEFNKNEEKIWGRLPTNVQKYNGDISDYYQKITDKDFKEPKYFEKSKDIIEAENEIENEIKRFERKLAKIVEPEDLAKLKKYRLINNLIVVSELKEPSALFKTREELMAAAGKKKAKKDYMDEEEYLRKLKHLVGIKYDTFQELSDAKEEVKSMEDSVDKEIAEKYEDIVKQFMLKRTLKSEKLSGHKFDNAGDIIDINDIEHLVNEILRKEYTDIDLMKQDKMQLDNMIDKYKKEEPDAEKELGEIKLLLSQIDRKLQGMSITVIGKGKSVSGLDGEDDDDDEEDEVDVSPNNKTDSKEEELEKEKK